MKRIEITHELFEYIEAPDTPATAAGSPSATQGAGDDYDLLNHDTKKIIISSNKAKQNAVLQGKKGHLVYLFPLLANCITCKENDLKNQLKEIFMEVAAEIGLHEDF